MSSKKIKSALISVFHKDGLVPIIQTLDSQGVTIYSTGGTQRFITDMGISAIAVDDLTRYPAIFSGRVKTLHPKIFGGILNRRDHTHDAEEKAQHDIPDIDLVMVNLYPFEATVASGAAEADIIEKIDIGGISLIRAAAKNFQDVCVVSAREQYEEVLHLLEHQKCTTTLAQRKTFAQKAFDLSSHYDTVIFNYFSQEHPSSAFKQSIRSNVPLRYGENPHQKGTFYGALDHCFEQLSGKALSYNNLLDIDAAISLVLSFGPTPPAFAIVKHTNACGVAQALSVKEAYFKALSSDPISAFGGVLITNQTIDHATAEAIHTLFFEVLIAPDYEESALALLQSKKKRILLRLKAAHRPAVQFKSLLNGVLWQETDREIDTMAGFKTVTRRAPSETEQEALVLAAKVCKHAQSNAIVLANAEMMLASGVGQTSRIDALKQAIQKAKQFDLSLTGAVMASDAFFPFPDCVEIAHQAGITAVIQPGGSMKDQASIDYCNEANLAMVMTGTRHFRHG